MADYAYDGQARNQYVAKAEQWTAEQAERLGTTPALILDAVRERAWLPEQIERVKSRYELESPPPLLEGVDAWVEAKIAKATRRPRAA